MTAKIHCDRCGEVRFDDVFLGYGLTSEELAEVESALVMFHNSMMHKTGQHDLSGRK